MNFEMQIDHKDEYLDPKLQEKVAILSKIKFQLIDDQSEIIELKTLTNSFEEESLQIFEDPEHIYFIPNLSNMSDNTEFDPLNRAFILENSQMTNSQESENPGLTTMSTIQLPRTFRNLNLDNWDQNQSRGSQETIMSLLGDL